MAILPLCELEGRGIERNLRAEVRRVDRPLVFQGRQKRQDRCRALAERPRRSEGHADAEGVEAGCGDAVLVANGAVGSGLPAAR